MDKIERRQYIRIPANTKITYSIEGDSSKTVRETYINNMSEGGILICVADPLPISVSLDLYIHSPRLPRPIRTKSKVVRIKEITEHKLYEIGLSFVEIKDSDLRFIKKWIQTVDLDKILSVVVGKNISDVHFVADHPPILRMDGELMNLHTKALTADEIRFLIYELLNEQQKEQFEKELELDFSYVNDYGRFRINIHQEKGQIGAVFRYIPTEIKSLEELGLPEILRELVLKPNGLVLVTGPIGCGKSTTLAAMIEVINKEKKCIIMSLEEPIEYLYKSKRSIIEQREIGIDARSFINALKYTVRQDVDVILIGEIRDLTSISIALTAAETGHLVLTTLHTLDVVSSINRIVDAFPANQQQQIRMMLAETLRGVVSQILLPRKDQEGRTAATEVLMCNAAVANIIRRGRLEELHSVMEIGAQKGMHTMDRSLEELYNRGIVSLESVLSYAKDLTRFT
jgi:twitching motility protein PilT